MGGGRMFANPRRLGVGDVISRCRARPGFLVVVGSQLLIVEYRRPSDQCTFYSQRESDISGLTAWTTRQKPGVDGNDWCAERQHRFPPRRCGRRFGRGSEGIPSAGVFTLGRSHVVLVLNEIDPITGWSYRIDRTTRKRQDWDIPEIQ